MLLEGFEHEFVEVFPRWKDLSTLSRVSRRWKLASEHELSRRMKKSGVTTLDNTDMPWKTEREIRIAVWKRYFGGRVPQFTHPLRSRRMKELNRYILETGFTSDDKEMFDKYEKRGAMIRKMTPLLFGE